MQDLHALFLRCKFWLKDYLQGSPIGKPYRETQFIQEHSYEEGLPIREKHLHDLLDFMRKNSPFYAQFSGYDLSAYPVVSKAFLVEHHDEMVVPEDKIPGQEGPVFVQRTSGSTGTPLAMPQSTLKRRRRVAEIKYFVKTLGAASHEKLIHLRTWNQWQSKSLKQIRRENIVPFDIKRVGEEDLVELCKLINSEKAVSIRTYASTLDRIAEVAHKHGFTFPSLKLIVTSSEALEDDARAKARRYMGCEVTSQYADEECGILASEHVPTQDADNRMYFNWAGYYVEVLKLDSDEPAGYGELGRIVLTDLHNYAFPVIRYDTNDTCILLPPDEYSHGYPVMGKLYGRRFDLTYATDGTPIYPLAYGRILKNYDEIRQWQFVQKDEREYELRLVLREKGSWQTEQLDKLFRDILGADAKISLQEVEELPPMPSGKRKPVENLWRPQNQTV